MERCDLSSARSEFERDGFHLHPEPLIPGDVVEKAIEGMDAVRAGEYETGIPPQKSYWNPGDDLRKLCKIEMPQISNRAIRNLISHARLGELAARVTGASMVQVWWVQLLYKPPADPDGIGHTNIGWHQDRHYWRVWEDGSELFTAWVALTDVQEDCGPMRFIRGSHRWGLRGHSDFYGQDHDAQRSEIDIPAGERWEETPALLRPGGVSFHHNLTYHGSGPNRSGGPRRSFAIHMRTEHSRPVDGIRQGLSQFIDDTSFCPVIYGTLTTSA